MKFMSISIFRFITLIVFGASSTLAFASPPVDKTISPMLQKVMPAVVNIRAQAKASPFLALLEQQKKRTQPNNNEEGEPDFKAAPNLISVGSGVIVDAVRGYVVTNAHVVNDAQTITVTLSDGRHFTARLVGMDKPSDIALLQIKAAQLATVPMGDSTKVKVGDYVAAIGNPFGVLSESVTAGIVSGLGRTRLGIENFENFIQIDASINPGNSGGALINMEGELIGINTAILAPNRGSIGIGFAIPINMVKSVIQQLIQFGDVKRGALGISVLDLTPELANAFQLAGAKGALISQVLPNSPGESAQLQIGDVITSVNQTEIKSANDLVSITGFLRVNSKVNLKIVRGHKPMDISISLSDPRLRKEAEKRNEPFLYGVSLKNFDITTPVHGSINGVLVASVDEDSNAWISNLRAGDVITHANQHEVKNIAELQKISKTNLNALLLRIIRGNGASFVVIGKES